jgi:hypothetical protein
MDMRRQHFRRKGEMDGPFSWGSVIDFFVWAVILAALFYGFFTFGRWYEQDYKQDKVSPAEIHKEFKSSRIMGH